jgi:hypothetical protein
LWDATPCRNASSSPGNYSITTEHHTPEYLNLQEYHLENHKYPNNFLNKKHSRCCDIMWTNTDVYCFWMEVWKIWANQSVTNMNWWQ